MERIRQRFGTNLRDARKKAGISQEELGTRAGLHLSAVSHHERGNREPRLSTVTRLAAALEIEPNVLFEGIDWLPGEPGRFEIEVKE